MRQMITHADLVAPKEVCETTVGEDKGFLIVEDVMAGMVVGTGPVIALA